MELSLPYVRRHFMVPMPVAESFDAMHARFLEQCVERRQAVLRAHSQSIGERMQADRLTHHVHILEMNGESFRLASSRKRQKDKEGSKMT